MIEAFHARNTRGHFVVVAANERSVGESADAIDDRIWIGAIADQIAEHKDGVVLGRRGERRLEGFEVCVDVAEHQVAHQYPIHSRIRSTISGTGPVASTRTCACTYASWRTWNRRSIWARSAASGRRPSAGTRSRTRVNGTSSQTTAPSASITDRLSGSTKVPPPVATMALRTGMRSCSTWRSRSRKYGSPCCAKIEATERRSRASIRSSTSSICQPRRLPSARATVVLPAPMKPTRYTLSVFTGAAGRGSGRTPGWAASYKLATGALSNYNRRAAIDAVLRRSYAMCCVHTGGSGRVAGP